MKYDDFELRDGIYELPKGEKTPRQTLHVWTQRDGQWACAAYDHGTFCRLCWKLDGIAAALISNALDGVMEVWNDPEKGLVCWLNEAGRTKVETALRRGGFDRGLDA